jgi:Flp pilus assembly pilin Flp
MGTEPIESVDHCHQGIEGTHPMTSFYAFFQSLLATSFKDEEGQTMAEYAVVLAVITVGIVVALTTLATGISTTLGNVTSKI